VGGRNFCDGCCCLGCDVVLSGLLPTLHARHFSEGSTVDSDSPESLRLQIY